MNPPAKQYSCANCGASPCVKAHLMPRALAHDLRGSEKHLVGGRSYRKGIDFLQSGMWDDKILCADCEAKFGEADDYGVRFIRSVAARPIPGDRRYISIDNPHPPRLVRFVLACIWRCLASEYQGSTRIQLGPYDDAVKRVIFDGADAGTFQLIILHAPTEVAGRVAPIFIGPQTGRFVGERAWFITIGWIVALVRFSRNAWPWLPDELDGGKAQKLMVASMPPRPISEMHGFRGILEAMRKSHGQR